MSYSDQSSEPRIVGFESKPIPQNNDFELKKFALIGVAILFAGFLLFSPGIPTPASPADNGPKYVAPWKKNKSNKSAGQTLQEVQANIDRQMKKNQDLIRSINNRR